MSPANKLTNTTQHNTTQHSTAHNTTQYSTAQHNTHRYEHKTKAHCGLNMHICMYLYTQTHRKTFPRTQLKQGFTYSHRFLEVKSMQRYLCALCASMIARPSKTQCLPSRPEILWTPPGTGHPRRLTVTVDHQDSKPAGVSMFVVALGDSWCFLPGSRVHIV